MKFLPIRFFLAQIMVVATLPITAYSSNSTSQFLSADPRDSEKYSLAFNECVIDKVLAGAAMESSKASCLNSVINVCESKASSTAAKDQKSPSTSCSDLVTTATKNVRENGKWVDCDSGHCSIMFEFCGD
jgi:hypothetical protein